MILDSIDWFKGNNYWKIPYFMGTSMVSCRFSLFCQPIDWLKYIWLKLSIDYPYTNHILKPPTSCFLNFCRVLSYLSLKSGLCLSVSLSSKGVHGKVSTWGTEENLHIFGLIAFDLWENHRKTMGTWWCLELIPSVFFRTNQSTTPMKHREKRGGWGVSTGSCRCIFWNECPTRP